VCQVHNSSLEGKGRPTLNAAKWQTGWGGRSTWALFKPRGCHPTPLAARAILPLQGGITLTQQTASPISCPAFYSESSAGAPVTLSHRQLVLAVEGALADYFYDGVSPTLGQYAVDHIVGDILCRVYRVHQQATEDTQAA
jgi:hypothetical protein